MDHGNFATSILGIIGLTLLQFYQPLFPWLMLAFALILADLRFGVLNAKRKGETIRHSRMWRRTINKMMDYLCWVTLAGLLGQSLGDVLGAPILSIGLLVIIYGIELTSCINNYFGYKGINKKFNFWKFVHQPEIENAIEDKDEEEKEERKKSKENG